MKFWRFHFYHLSLRLLLFHIFFGCNHHWGNHRAADKLLLLSENSTHANSIPSEILNIVLNMANTRATQPIFNFLNHLDLVGITNPFQKEIVIYVYAEIILMALASLRWPTIWNMVLVWIDLFWIWAFKLNIFFGFL